VVCTTQTKNGPPATTRARALDRSLHPCSRPSQSARVSCPLLAPMSPFFISSRLIDFFLARRQHQMVHYFQGTRGCDPSRDVGLTGDPANLPAQDFSRAGDFCDRFVFYPQELHLSIVDNLSVDASDFVNIEMMSVRCPWRFGRVRVPLAARYDTVPVPHPEVEGAFFLQPPEIPTIRDMELACMGMPRCDDSSAPRGEPCLTDGACRKFRREDAERRGVCGPTLERP
jgi:hypothetical protein